MTTPILGVLGKAGAGKDTFAARLVDAHGWRRVAFADALKRAALATDPLIETRAGSVYHLRDLVGTCGWDVTKREPSARGYLQRFGVAMRAVDPGIWVRLAMGAAADAFNAGAPGVVITDVRFGDEVDAIYARCGRTVRIIRDDTHDLGDLAGHVSETALDHVDVDFIVDNRFDLGYLYDEADFVARMMTGSVAA